MKHKVFLVLIALSVFVPSAFGQQCWRDWQGLPPNAGLYFYQVTFSYPGSDGGPSGTGQIDLNIPQLTAYTGMNSGYINVVGNAGWIVQNLPVLSGFPYPDMSTTFNLNVKHGTLVTSLEAFVCYSPDAVSQAPRYNNPLSYSNFTVSSLNYNSNLFAEPPPPPIGFTFPGGSTYFSCQNSYNNVQAATNQCAPAAVANGLSWLLGYLNEKGLRDEDTLVGQLDMYMWSCRDKYQGRWAGKPPSRLVGDGVYAQPELLGTMDWLADQKIMTNLKHQGYVPSAPGCGGAPFNLFSGGNDVQRNGLVSKGQGEIVDPNFIYNEISAGRAVEWGWASAGGGHAEEVICAGSILGLPFAARVSDHLQTNMDPGDNQGTEFIDFSFLLQQPGQQPVLQGGIGSGATVLSVTTQGP